LEGYRVTDLYQVREVINKEQRDVPGQRISIKPIATAVLL